MAKVLLTGGRIPSALELARALSAAGMRVFVADSYARYLCQGSLAVEKSFVVPSPRWQRASWELALKRIIQEEEIDWLIPTNEEVLYLSQIEWPKGLRVFMSSHDILRQCHHKQDFNELAHRLGLTVPASCLLKKNSLAVQVLSQRAYCIKPCYSRGGYRLIQAQGGVAPEEFSIALDGSYLIQKWIEGETLCSFSIIQKGQVKASLCYRSKVTLGRVAMIFERMEEPQIDAFIEKFVNAVSYEGFISFDFQKTKEGQILALECNPRLTSGIHLMPWREIADAIFGEGSSQYSKNSKRQAQILVGVLSALPELLRSPGKLLLSIKEMLRTRDVMFDLRDWWPLLYQIPCYLYFWRRARAARLPLAACAMDGVEWDEDGENAVELPP